MISTMNWGPALQPFRDNPHVRSFQGNLKALKYLKAKLWRLQDRFGARLPGDSGFRAFRFDVIEIREL